MKTTRFNSILIDPKIYTEYVLPDHQVELKDLAQINIFVGPNNSGKSRLLRKLFSDESLQFTSGEFDISALNEAIVNFQKDYGEVREKLSSVYLPEISERVHKLPRHPFRLKHMDMNIINDFIRQAKRNFSDSYHYSQPQSHYKTVLDKYIPQFEKIIPENNGVVTARYENIYIPILRGLRPLQSNSSNHDSFYAGHDSYFYRTRHDYFKKDLKSEHVYTGQNLYNDLLAHMTGDRESREMVDDFEKFLSYTFFQNEEVELIPKNKSDVPYVRIGDIEQPIYNLGDGIQAIIILTYPLFFNQDKALKVFIEEPENNLHPGFQRLFMKTLSDERFKDFQYFITSHSNHLLDMTLEKDNTSVYTFEALPESKKFVITNVENAQHNVLELLGVRNSSVFLSNCTIWVEGITDRLYIRKFLEVFQQTQNIQFLEDIHYSFVEYGGSNITHWSFLEDEDANHRNIFVDRLCGKIFLITDSDNAGTNKDGKRSKKILRQEQLKEKLKERYYCLPVKEIENILHPEVIFSAVSDTEGTTLPKPGENFFKDVKRKGIGELIEANIENLSKAYADPSGTIKSKVEFAKAAIKHIHSTTDLSEEAIGLAQSIYSFIKTHNHTSAMQ